MSAPLAVGDAVTFNGGHLGVVVDCPSWAPGMVTVRGKGGETTIPREDATKVGPRTCGRCTIPTMSRRHDLTCTKRSRPRPRRLSVERTIEALERRRDGSD